MADDIGAAVAAVEAAEDARMARKQGSKRPPTDKVKIRRMDRFRSFLTNDRKARQMQLIMEWFEERFPGLEGLALAQALTEEDFHDLDTFLASDPAVLAEFPPQRTGRTAIQGFWDDLHKAWQYWRDSQ